MPPKNSSDKSYYKSKMKLDLEKFKNGGVQAARVDLAKVKIKTLATKIGVLSEGVKIYAFIQFKGVLCFK